MSDESFSSTDESMEREKLRIKDLCAQIARQNIPRVTLFPIDPNDKLNLRKSLIGVRPDRPCLAVSTPMHHHFATKPNFSHCGSIGGMSPIQDDIQKKLIAERSDSSAVSISSPTEAENLEDVKVPETLKVQNNKVSKVLEEIESLKKSSSTSGARTRSRSLSQRRGGTSLKEIPNNIETPISSSDSSSSDLLIRFQKSNNTQLIDKNQDQLNAYLETLDYGKPWRHPGDTISDLINPAGSKDAISLSCEESFISKPRNPSRRTFLNRKKSVAALRTTRKSLGKRKSSLKNSNRRKSSVQKKKKNSKRLSKEDNKTCDFATQTENNNELNKNDDDDNNNQSLLDYLDLTPSRSEVSSVGRNSEKASSSGLFKVPKNISLKSSVVEKLQFDEFDTLNNGDILKPNTSNCERRRARKSIEHKRNEKQEKNKQLVQKSTENNEQKQFGSKNHRMVNDQVDSGIESAVSSIDRPLKKTPKNLNKCFDEPKASTSNISRPVFDHQHTNGSLDGANTSCRSMIDVSNTKTETLKKNKPKISLVESSQKKEESTHSQLVIPKRRGRQVDSVQESLEKKEKNKNLQAQTPKRRGRPKKKTGKNSNGTTSLPEKKSTKEGSGCFGEEPSVTKSKLQQIDNNCMAELKEINVSGSVIDVTSARLKKNCNKSRFEMEVHCCEDAPVPDVDIAATETEPQPSNITKSKKNSERTLVSGGDRPASKSKSAAENTPLEGVRRSSRTRKQTQSTALRYLAALDYEKEHKDLGRSKRVRRETDLSTIEELGEQPDHQVGKPTKLKKTQAVEIQKQKLINGARMTMSMQDFDNCNMTLQHSVHMGAPIEMMFEDAAGITLFSYIDNPHLNLGTLVFQPEEIKRKQKASSYSLTFVVTFGRARFQTKSTTYDGGEGDAFTIQKGQMYSIKNLKNTTILKLFFCKLNRGFAR